MKIDINLIKPDLNQPRKIFNDEYIKGLAKSLTIEGMINPVEIDENYIIITGEQRWRAAKLNGWTEIPVNLNKTSLPKYERFRRQMAENLHQSSADGGTPMNAIDVAEGYLKLLKMKGHFVDPTKFHQGKDEGISELSRELGISETKIRTYLKLLSEPDYVRQAIILDSNKQSSFIEASKAPEKYQEEIKKAIVEEKIVGHKQIRRFAKLANIQPKKAEIELARLMNKQSSDANRILDLALDLQIALNQATPSTWLPNDISMARSELGAVTGSIRVFVGKMNKQNPKVLEEVIPIT